MKKFWLKDKAGRGTKRMVRIMEREFKRISSTFPEREPHMWHAHMPANSSLFSRKRRKNETRKKTVRAILQATSELIANKPDTAEFTKVIAVIDTKFLHASQIVVFFDEGYFQAFMNFERDGLRQSHGRDFIKERNLKDFEGMKSNCFVGSEYPNAELWCVGEV